MNAESALIIVQEEVCACRKCPRLVKYREKVAKEKRRIEFVDRLLAVLATLSSRVRSAADVRPGERSAPATAHSAGP